MYLFSKGSALDNLGRKLDTCVSNLSGFKEVKLSHYFNSKSPRHEKAVEQVSQLKSNFITYLFGDDTNEIADENEDINEQGNNASLLFYNEKKDYEVNESTTLNDSLTYGTISQAISCFTYDFLNRVDAIRAEWDLESEEENLLRSPSDSEDLTQVNDNDSEYFKLSGEVCYF